MSTVGVRRSRVAFAGAFAVRLAERGLINVSRAEIVDELALYQALAQKTIAGAILDVWYQYPTGPGPILPAHQAFQALPNVLMTPHVSGWTEGMLEARATLIAENIRRAARGEPPVHLIPAAA